MLKIVTVPDKILNTPTKPITMFDRRLKNLVKEMEETLIAQKDPLGVGLAANQVGYPLSLFIIKPSEKEPIEVFINPKILKIDSKKKKIKTDKNLGKKPVKLEGCLSIPKIWGPVKRAEKILIEFQDIEGQKKIRWYRGFKAVIIQHEIDHLQGVVFTQRVLEQKNPLYKEKEGQLKPVDLI